MVDRLSTSLSCSGCTADPIIDFLLMQMRQLFELIHSQKSELRSQKQATEEAIQATEEIRNELISYKTNAHYWEAQFKQLKTRETELKDKLEEAKAQLRKREQQLFGRRSEKNTKSSKNESGKEGSKKKRGQQPGNSAPKRRAFADLPIVEEEVDLIDELKHCCCCQLPYEPLMSTEDSEVVDIIEVQAHLRKIKRQRYKRRCQCPQNPDPQIITPPVTERVFPRSRLGITVWAHILIGKYELQNPLQRVLAGLSMRGLPLSTGSVTGGLQKILPLLSPIYDAIVSYNTSAGHWHADETGWKVFEKIEGKHSANWYLWIFHNEESVVFRISPSRSSQVLKDYFGEDHPGGTLNVDRYVAYKAIAKTGIFQLAYCWAHVRRDFLDYAKGFPKREQWALDWVNHIAKLYHINNQRLELKPKSKAFKQKQAELKQQLKSMSEQMTNELSDEGIWQSAKKILLSLSNHWDGLTLFADCPEIPMDNNTAERGLRSSVVGRKNYYGSGSVWSAKLAATMFSILKTLKLWGINPHTWLLSYLYECAYQGGRPPDPEAYLPWNMSEELLEKLKAPPKGQFTSTS